MEGEEKWEEKATFLWRSVMRSQRGEMWSCFGVSEVHMICPFSWKKVKSQHRLATNNEQTCASSTNCRNSVRDSGHCQLSRSGMAPRYFRGRGEKIKFLQLIASKLSHFHIPGLTVLQVSWVDLADSCSKGEKKGQRAS